MLTITCLLLSVPLATAALRSSGDYSIQAEALDSGGARVSSAAYTHDGSLGGVTGVSSVSAPEETAKAGYVAQLYEVTGISISAAAKSVNEGATLQVGATQVLDDSTLLVLATNAPVWSVVSGPLVSVSSGGLATAGTVYQSTPATLGAAYQGFNATLGLTVVNVSTDDFGSYAGDGLPDDWQAQWFGINNPNAAPNADADGTGQNNLFKWIAGLNPLNRAVFSMAASPVPGQPGKMRFAFSPIVPGRSYTVQFNDTLLPGNWQTLTGYSQQDNGQTRTVTDNAAPGDHRFYRVQITLP